MVGWFFVNHVLDHLCCLENDMNLIKVSLVGFELFFCCLAKYAEKGVEKTLDASSDQVKGRTESLMHLVPRKHPLRQQHGVLPIRHGTPVWQVGTRCFLSGPSPIRLRGEAVGPFAVSLMTFALTTQGCFAWQLQVQKCFSFSWFQLEKMKSCKKKHTYIYIVYAYKFRQID